MSENEGHLPRCWCGNTKLMPYSSDYSKCTACGGTLVATVMPSAEISIVHDEDTNYYGRNYWFEHQQNDLHQPTILSRARSDLSDRVLHWTRTLLQYKTPPCQVYELGSGNGGFIAMLRMLGYDAIGSELSPSIVKLVSQIYDIPLRVGSVEEQGFEPATFDMIVLMDVLEHLTDPSGTLEHCLRLLKTDGILVVQTPLFPVHLSYAEMMSKQEPFLKMLIPKEHLYLFSKESVTELLRRLGTNYITFETPIFAHYDMFFVASRQPIIKRSQDEVQLFLESSPHGRLIQAMIDLDDQGKKWFDAYQQADHDRTGRQKQIKILNDLLREAEVGREARFDLLNKSDTEIESLQQKRVVAGQASNPDGENPYHLKGLAKQLFEILNPTRTTIMQAGEFGAANTRIIKQKRIKSNVELKCIVIDLIPVLPGAANGGAKIFTLQLVKDLVKLLPDCLFILLTSDISDDELAVLDAPNAMRYCVYQPANPSSAESHERLIRLLKQWFKIDLLFCPFTLPIFPLDAVPIVSVIYDLQHLYYPQFFSGSEIAERNRNFQQATKLAAYLTCISEYVRQSVLENTQLSPMRVRTIYLNASQLVDGNPNDTEILPTLGLTSNAYWLYPANFWPHKNHQVLLTAFSMYRQRHPDSPLKLVCTGAPNEYMKNLQQYAKLMQLADSVIFPGFLSQNGFVTLLKNAYALIFPSLYEGFGIPILEAMMLGTPVLCSNVTSLPEVAGDAAILFDPRKPIEITEAMERLEQEPELAAELVKRGSERASAFGNTETAEQYIELFREAVSDESYSTYVVQGIYNDGWVGETLKLVYEDCDTDRIFRAEFYLPDWVHDQQLKAVVAEKGFLKSYSTKNGSFITIERPLLREGGVVEIVFYPLLNLGLSQDKRSLAGLCRFFHVELPDETLELFTAGL